MPLSPGEKLGPYEILASIGKGGMGEVWRARDPRLGRDVAIKVSADQFSDRFEKEARSIAALNHSNICTLYDVGPNYLVMELIDGPTLADRILEGPIPLTEALPIARQIADALEAAHEKGIVHRDLKPGNVKIRPDGSVKVLDFGLAKSVFGETKVTSDSPTLMQMPTQMGVILGTAAYMPPEQARGKPVDKRADIWSFGVVFYEMLTGQRLFQGEDLTETLAAVVKTEPDLSVVPPQVKRLLTKCLQKDPRNRLRDIGDAWELLDDPAAPAPATAAPSRLATKLWMALAAVLSIATGLTSWALWQSKAPVARPLLRLTVDLGSDVSLPAPPGPGTFAVSPDGTRLVYRSGKPAKLFVRRLDQPQATELPGTEGAGLPFFSPDSHWIGFDANHRVSKISVDGGAVVPLAEIKRTLSGASWGEDGFIIAGEPQVDGLVRIPESGGPAETLLPLSSGETALVQPQILPGGKAVLFTNDRVPDPNHARIEVLSLTDRRRKVVLPNGGTPARYVRTPKGSGYLIYTDKASRALLAVPFDLDKLETRGLAVPILDDLAFNNSNRNGQVSFSDAPSGHGTVVYSRSFGGGISASRTMRWLDQAGRSETLTRINVNQWWSGLRVSPDGKRVAFVTDGAGGGTESSDVWAYDTKRNAMTRLTFDAQNYGSLLWSPDGRYIVLRRNNDLNWIRADGASRPQLLLQAHGPVVPSSFTPDGKHLAFVLAFGIHQIWTVPVETQGGQFTAGKPEQFIRETGFNSTDAAFSPDGHWLAYASDESGKYEVYVRAFPAPSSGQGGKSQISGNGGVSPHWSRDGHELMFQSGDAIMAASYSVKGDNFVAEKPRVWIPKIGGSAWDLAPDGKRIAVLTSDDPAEAPKPEHEVVFLENFFDELQRKVPAGK